MENKNSQTTQTTSWTASDQEKIVKTLSVIINGQKSFGKETSIADTFAYYQMKLDGRFAADKVIAALDAYTDTKPDIPAPADLIALMDPPEPKITQAEFIHAKEQWKLEGYPSHSYYAYRVKKFEKQEADPEAKPVNKIGTTGGFKQLS